MRAGKIRKSAKTLYPGEIMADFEEYLKPGKRGHLIGVGGVSMAPLAEVLAGMGLVIDGSDMSESEKTRHLRELGIDVKIGHSAMNVAPDIQFVVRTAAVGDTNPEIVEARARGVPVFERAEAWGAIMRDYENALCIAGTHGKTTTTSMCTHILMAAERDPTVMIGGTLPLLHAGHRVGGGDTIILESCEYHDSFLAFHPTVAVILDVDADHLDYFSGLEDVEKSFRAFAAKVPPTGRIVANLDDRNTMETLEPLGRELVTFGLTDRADVYARNIRRSGASSTFDIYYHGRLFTSVTLHVPGMHNVKNALAATAACLCLGVRPNAVKYGLAGFTGAGRRFEFKGKYNGADIYDDYAHHPQELKALLDAVSRWAITARCSCSSRTPTRARPRSSTTSSSSCGGRTSPTWRRSTPRASRTRWASPPRTLPRTSRAAYSAPTSPTSSAACARRRSPATSSSPSARGTCTR